VNDACRHGLILPIVQLFLSFSSSHLLEARVVVALDTGNDTRVSPKTSLQLLLFAEVASDLSALRINQAGVAEQTVPHLDQSWLDPLQCAERNTDTFGTTWEFLLRLPAPAAHATPPAPPANPAAAATTRIYNNDLSFLKNVVASDMICLLDR
jgi:hypothetical protein